MKKEITKFSEFNGKSIHFLAANGEYWIALKPICEILGVDYSSEIKKIEESEYLTEHSSEQTIVSDDGKLKKMICLPECLIYGWIFQIESNAPGLANFKRACFAVLNSNPTTQSLAAKICQGTKTSNQL